MHPQGMGRWRDSVSTVKSPTADEAQGRSHRVGPVGGV